ncbi:MAG: amidohydrolase family protein, partial [Gemmatimonadales bacterium]
MNARSRTTRWLAPLALLGVVGCGAAAAPAADAPYDLVIANGRIVDGTGNPWYEGDVGVRGDRIASITPKGGLAGAATRERVDAAGLVVSPGFIDIQSHSWHQLLFADGRVVGKISQGVTSEILGEARTPAPTNARFDSLFSGGDAGDSAYRARWAHFRGPHGFGAWLDSMEAHGNAVNVGSYLGAATVRAYAMSAEEGAPDAAALDTMRAVVQNAMLDGAFGISSALIYPPGSYAGTDELIEMAKAMAPLHGTYITHVRSEERRLLSALDEAIRIGKEGGVPVEIYHLKAAGTRNWSKARAMIAKIDSARATGFDVQANMYPYTAGGTGLAACLPPFASEDGKLMANVSNAAARAHIRAEVEKPTSFWESLCEQATPEGVLITSLRSPANQKYAGKRLGEIAKDMGKDWLDTVMDPLKTEQGNIGTIYFLMSEDNVKYFLAQPWMKIGTDAGGT